jgi:two-component system, NarL family, response regulator LiaR
MVARSKHQMGQIDQIRVLIVDGHAYVRRGLAAFFDIVGNLTLVGEAANGPEALHLCYMQQPDVVLVDLKTEGLDGVTVTRLINQYYSNVQVIALASDDEDKNLIDEALAAGAVVALPKHVSADELINAIRTAYATRAFQ